MKLKRKVLAMVVSLAMVASVLVPVSAFGATWEAPTTPMTVDKDIVRVAGHAANSTESLYLGANLITTRQSDVIGSKLSVTSPDADILNYVKNNNQVAVFGTSINDAPDPYWWNYFYNAQAKVNNQTTVEDALTLVNAGSPMMALLNDPVTGVYDDELIDSAKGTAIPHAVGLKPDIMVGTEAYQGKTYDDYLKLMKDYKGNGGTWDPQLLAYKNDDLNAFIDDMYNLSDAIKASGKKGRYGDTEAIAKNYEAYIKGLQLYVAAKIADGTVKKKTVAVIGATANDDGTYNAYKVNMTTSTAASNRAVEYVENTTNDVIDTRNIKNTGTESAPQYLVTAKDLLTVDAIYITGHQQQSADRDTFIAEVAAKAGVDSSKVPEVYATDPKGAFGSITANSVDNIMGIGMYQGFAYPDLIDPTYAATYIFEKFYHISSAANYKTMAEAALQDASLPSGYSVNTVGYSASYIDDRINEGMAYYYANKSTLSKTKMAPSSRLSKSDFSWSAKKGATVTDSNNSNGVYKVTNAKNKTVTYQGPKNKKATTVTIPATIKVYGTTYKVTAIANKAFKNNKYVKTVKISKNIKTIGVSAFANCKKLQKVTIGKSVTTIKASAFSGCVKLKSISLPAKTKKIGAKAFANCKKLKKITIKSKKLTSGSVGKQAFKKVPARATVNVPNSKVKKYTKLLRAKGLNKKCKIK